jgi:hypothetical protein
VLFQESPTERLTLSGAYIELLVYLYDKRRCIKDSDHVAKILRISPRTSRKLWGKLEPKFLKLRHGYTHKLVAQILANKGRIKELQDLEACLEKLYHSCTYIEPEPEPDITIPNGIESEAPN